MTRLPLTHIEHHYDEVSELCKKTGEPVFLTDNGRDDLVVLSVEAFERAQALLALKERLIDIELDPGPLHSLHELDSALREITK